MTIPIASIDFQYWIDKNANLNTFKWFQEVPNDYISRLQATQELSNALCA